MSINELRIAIPAVEETKDSRVDDRFARCNVYALYQNGDISFNNNLAKEEMSGAGVKAAKQISEMGANIALVPEIGPKAYDALEAFGIEMYRYDSKDYTLREAVDALLKGKLKKIEGFTHKGKH